MHNVELNINDQDLEIGTKFDMGQFSNRVRPGNMFLGIRYLHGHEDHSDFKVAKDIEDYIELNFLMQKHTTRRLIIGLGVKANYTAYFSSFPLGIEAAYRLHTSLPIPFYIKGSFYYAPEVLSSIDAKNFLEYKMLIDAEVIRNAHIVVGYRNLDTNYEKPRYGGNINYNHSFFFGFKFDF